MSEKITITKEEAIPTIHSEESTPVPEPVSPIQTTTAAEPVLQTAAATNPQPQAMAEPVLQTAAAANPQPQAAPIQDADILEDELPDEPAEEEKPKRRHFRSRSSDADFSRDKWILSRIDDAHMMEYLTLEQKRFEQIQAAKEKRERRIFTAFRLTVSLAAIVAVVYLLKDNPTILVNILYIAGILAAIWFLKNPKEKDKSDKTEK